jgi:acid ceramidase
MNPQFKLSVLITICLLILCESKLKFLEDSDSQKYGQIISPSTRQYHINLEDDLYTQLKPVLEDKLAYLKNLTSQIIKNVPEEIITTLRQKLPDIKNNQNKDWLQLLSVTANITQMDFEEVLLSNILYEVMCTSIIIDSGITDPTTGVDEIFMGRNLDFDFTNLLEDLAYEGHYYLNNELQFISQGIAGYVSPLNGVKIGKFSVSINERFSQKDVVKGIERISQGDMTSTFLLYNILRESQNYNQSIEVLSRTPISSPAYYIISGVQKNEGAIITRSYDKVDEFDQLDVENGKWYLVQTNSDRKTPLDQDYRRYTAELRLNDLETNQIKLFHEVLMSEVMVLEPNKNKDTAYSTVQSPFNGGYFKSIYY